jgi:hypothetical protein
MNDSELFGSPVWHISLQNFGSSSAYVQTHLKTNGLLTAVLLTNAKHFYANLIKKSTKIYKTSQN